MTHRLAAKHSPKVPLAGSIPPQSRSLEVWRLERVTVDVARPTERMSDAPTSGQLTELLAAMVREALAYERAQEGTDGAKAEPAETDS